MITIATSAQTVPLPELRSTYTAYREEREQIVTQAVRQSLAAAQALHEIHTYREGLLWREDFRTFADYCSRHWGYAKSEAYRHVQTGSLVARLEQSHSPIGENSGVVISHLRPVCEMVPEDHQVECWKAVAARLADGGKVTAALVKQETVRFLEKNEVEPKQKKPQRPAKPDDRSIARVSIRKLEIELSTVVPKAEYQPLLDELMRMIDATEAAASQPAEAATMP